MDPKPNKGGGSKKYINKALAYKVRDDDYVEVYDLDFAAYCGQRNLIVVDMVEEARPRYYGRKRGPAHFLFLFHDPMSCIAQLAIDYTNSESAKHADSVRRFKKAIRSTNTNTEG